MGEWLRADQGKGKIKQNNAQAQRDDNLEELADVVGRIEAEA